MKINEYYSMEMNRKELSSNAHREAVGGLWEEIGRLQFDFLVSEGLKPHMTMVDVGCGSLRGGVHFVRYLDAGNYFGIDANKSLLNAGYEKELFLEGLHMKLPRENLVENRHFDFSLFKIDFDFALAQSVFTHLPLNHIRLCLINLARQMKSSGRFYATFFECPENANFEDSQVHAPGDIQTYPDLDPYHYRLSDFRWFITGLPWQLRYIGEWGHPRAQKMVCFIRS